MGAIARFLLALNRLAKAKGFKIEDAYRFAKQEFGEITPLLRKQIQNVFDKIKKPVVGKPGKKEGAVIPMVKEGTKKAEGIESIEAKMEGIDETNRKLGDAIKEYEKMYNPKPLSEAESQDSPLMDRLDKKIEEMRLSDDDPMGDLEQILNPRRSGGSLDPAIGITRGLARKILDRKGIEIGKKDPIDVFTDTFGEAITDVKNLADEMIEAEQIGRNLKSPDELLEIEGLFDIEIPKNPQRGLTDEELLKLEKQIKEEKILEDFDPTFRKPNAKGGLTRTSYALGKGPVLPSDEDPINPFGPKPIGPVLPDKSMMASGYGSFKDFVEEVAGITGDFELLDLYDDFLKTGDDTKMMLRLKKLGYQPGEYSTGGRVQAASGGLAEILKL